MSLPARQFWLVTGQADLARQRIEQALAAFDPAQLSYIGDQANELPIAKVGHLLGQDRDAVVINAWAGFCPDALAAAAGTIRAGGLLILICPALAEWPAYADPQARRLLQYPLDMASMGQGYLTRLVSLLKAHPAVTIFRLENGDRLPKLSPPLARSGPTKHEPINADQAAAVEVIQQVLKGQRRKPLLLSADRGRGKSAALGLAAAALLRMGSASKIIVTAATYSGAETLFKHASQSLGMAIENRRIDWPAASNEVSQAAGGSIQFLAADHLIAAQTECDLVLVDEAAALPGPILSQLAQRYSRIAFATTLHGYEGSGRGFALRFAKALEKSARGLRRVELSKPIRWAENDPLEQCLFELLLLDCEPEPLSQHSSEATHVLRLNRSELAQNEAQLRALFALLVEAHYRTRPRDLRHLLDSPGLQLFAQFSKEQLVGVAVVSIEGGLSEQEAEQVALGKRRPHGHLLPELLCSQMGLLAAAQCRIARVQRIVIHPSLQGQGLGSQLLSELRRALKNQVDLIGSSFAADAALLRFWLSNQFQTIRIGDRPNKTSGLHSLAVLSASTDAGQALLNAAQLSYRKQLQHQLPGSLRELDTAVIDAALLNLKITDNLDDQDWLDLACFAYGNRPLESSLYALKQFCLTEFSLPLDKRTALETEQSYLLIAAILQRRGWAELGLGGKAPAISKLRAALRQLLVKHHHKIQAHYPCIEVNR